MQHVFFTSALSLFFLHPYQKFLKRESSLQRQCQKRDKPHLHGSDFAFLVFYLRHIHPHNRVKRRKEFKEFILHFPHQQCNTISPHFAEKILGTTGNQNDLVVLCTQLTNHRKATLHCKKSKALNHIYNNSQTAPNFVRSLHNVQSYLSIILNTAIQQISFIQ